MVIVLVVVVTVVVAVETIEWLCEKNIAVNWRRVVHFGPLEETRAFQGPPSR